MCEAKPSRRDAGRIFYDGPEAWTVAIEDGTPAWKRIPEMDAKPTRELEESPGGKLTGTQPEKPTEALKETAGSESTQEN